MYQNLGQKNMKVLKHRLNLFFRNKINLPMEFTN